VNSTTVADPSLDLVPAEQNTALPTLQSLSPIDIAQQRFPLAWRGYRPADVQQFLAMVAEQVAQLQATCRLLEARVRLSEAAGLTLDQRQAALDDAVLQAQGAAEKMTQETQQAAATALQQANTQAQAVIQAATAQAQRLATDSTRLQAQRRMLLEELRGVLCTHSRLLEVLEDESPTPAEPTRPRAVLDQLRVPHPPGAPAPRAAQPSVRVGGETASPARHSNGDCHAPA
jgi:cell division initiation protein